MQYRTLGTTGLQVSEIGFGGEWLERHPFHRSVKLMQYAEEQGINVIDCWMPHPKSRDVIGTAIRGHREKWIIQGHVGATWQKKQYVRTRDVQWCRTAFEDLLQRLDTDYIDLGMIHYVDAMEDWDRCMNSDYIRYVEELHRNGTIRHVGLSTHNPRIAKVAIESGVVEMIMFSINPAFDMRPATEDIHAMYKNFTPEMAGIDPEREELYRMCEERGVGITVMKGYFGGRLFDAKTSPFGVAFSPVQCLHYALTRPGVATVLCGYDTKKQIDEAVAYETATDAEKDYASILANAPLHAYSGACVYCGHCKPCPVNIDIAMVNKFYDLAVQQPEVPESVKAHYEALGITASACVGCKGCETRCPFGVGIAERMKKTAELFGR